MQVLFQRGYTNQSLFIFHQICKQVINWSGVLRLSLYTLPNEVDSGTSQRLQT